MSAMSAEAEAIRIATEQLQQSLKNFKQPKMEKKIIGYKIKNDKYKKAAMLIAETSVFLNEERMKYSFAKGSRHHLLLKEAGVLDLWFIPVYESQTLEVGKWYMDTDGDIFFIEKWEESFTDSGYGYGFCRGDWTVRENGSNYAFRKGFRPATDKEVESALIEEAKKRGFNKAGVTYYYPDQKHIPERTFKNELRYDEGALLDRNSVIFNKGQWAEIIESTTLPEIGGYQGENKNNYLKYGCTEVPKSLIQGMSDLGITSFNLKVDGKKIKVSKAQTKQLFEYINKE